jgi:hypothetical protein
MVAWNGDTLAALAALAASAPLHLRLAEEVDVVQIGNIGKGAPAGELASHLAPDWTHS